MGSSPDNTMWCLYVNHAPAPKNKLRERTKNWPWGYSSGLGGSSHRKTKKKPCFQRDFPELTVLSALHELSYLTVPMDLTGR